MGLLLLLANLEAVFWCLCAASVVGNAGDDLGRKSR